MLSGTGIAFALGGVMAGGGAGMVYEQVFDRKKVEYDDGKKFGDPVSRYADVRSMENVSYSLFLTLWYELVGL